MANVEIQNVSKEVESGPVLYPLDLRIKTGIFTSFLGPSGCGKTILLKIIAGLERPDTGRVLFDGEAMADVSQNKFISPAKRHVATVFQNHALWPHMTVYENVAFPLQLQKKTERFIKEETLNALGKLKLSGLKGRLPHALSWDEQQRVALARAIVQKPSVLILDEPLIHLENPFRNEMRKIIRGLQQKLGLTAIMATQEWVDARALSDTIVVIQEGRIEQEGTVTGLIENPNSNLVRSLIQDKAVTS